MLSLDQLQELQTVAAVAGKVALSAACSDEIVIRHRSADVDPAEAIRRCAAQVRHLSGKLYDPDDLEESSRPRGVEADRRIAEEAEVVADRFSDLVPPFPEFKATDKPMFRVNFGDIGREHSELLIEGFGPNTIIGALADLLNDSVRGNGKNPRRVIIDFPESA